jgi:hypothetical protein
MNFNLNPPNEFRWQIGKTAATIKFVNDAENYINKYSLCAKSINVLNDYIKQLKDGREILMEWYTVEEFLTKNSKSSDI